jgi:cytochrome c biogenesis protein CcmG, thiol:disulfide interchange protein DsbE
MRRALIWVPLALIAFVAGLFLYRLVNPADNLKPSQMSGRMLPEFSLPPGIPGESPLTSAMLRDSKPKIINIFASWCVPCAAEAKELEALKAAGIPIYGIAIRDKPEDLTAFFAKHGNPFIAVGSDRESAVQFALGSSGVPESFLLDGKGVIKRQIQGVIKSNDVPAIIAEMQTMK